VAEELGSAPRPAAVILTAETLVDKLTATEARIACAVAGGASNREIAERMFLSVKTVEATLTRIYRKLGIRSRTQLATLVR
jgi:DNA-binding NarL/FixJ family response regulator